MAYNGPLPQVIVAGGTAASSFNTNGAVISGTSSTAALAAVSLSNQALLVGNTSAAPTAKSLSINIRVFQATGTYTPTSGMVYCIIEAVGGGGGGGGTTISSANTTSAGGGGGGGGYARGVFSAATIGASATVTVGAAGTAGANTGGNGGTGGTSSVNVLISALGGVGGSGQTSSSLSAAGGVGGSGSGGSFHTAGSPGGSAVCWVNSGGTFGGTAGYGGSTYFGGGGSAQVDQSHAGTGGQTFGGGGSGGIDNNATSAQSGGPGSSGVVIITEFILS